MTLNYYSEEEDNNNDESVNKYKNLFSNYENNPPTLKEALKQMFKSSNLENSKTNELIEDILDKCKERINPEYDEIKKKYDNITKEDAYIICSYTCESLDKTYSPYRILNQSLVSDDRQNGGRNISKYIFIFLKSLRKLPRYYPENKYLYRCLTCKVNLSKDPNNEKIIPYILGNKKTFWGFTSTSPDPKMTYSFLKKEDKNKTGTIFTLGGDIWGYDIELFNYYNEKEILLEPERKFIVDNVLPPLNGVINITCTILKTPLILSNYEEELNNNNEIIDNNKKNYPIIKKYIIKFEMEAKIKEKKEYTSGIGVLCNIPSKNIKALLTFNNMINFDFLNETKKMILYIDNKEIEIDMKKNRYKYTNKELNISIIEIIDFDNIKDFMDIDKFINSRDYTKTEIISFFLNKKNIEMLNCEIKEKNKEKYISFIELNKEGIIILKENYKLMGLMNNNEIIPMNIIINIINFIKCKYKIKKEDIGKDIQIINNKNLKGENEEIKREIKIIIDGETKSNILTYKFDKEGSYIFYIISNNIISNISGLFNDCPSLKELNLSSFNTDHVTNMSNLFSNCTSLKELNLSSFNTNQVTNMSWMFSNCTSLKKLNLSSFNTSKVTDMSWMFDNCSSLKELNLSSFNTTQVINMHSMFDNCSLLKELDLSTFNTNNVNDMSWMFRNCSSLKKLNLSSFNIYQETYMSKMFHLVNRSCKIICKDNEILREFKNQSGCIIL